MTAPTSVSVGLLRVCGDGDEWRLRSNVQRLLAAADVRPRRLPPAAILVVRSLTDPLPGHLDPRAVLPGEQWQRSVAAALDERAESAHRPALGPVPASAESIVFADRAELLMCLARDWSAGATERWWWRALGITTPDTVLQAFMATPEVVPAALHRLETTVIVAFAARLPPPWAQRLTRAIASAFGVTPVADAALSPIAVGAVRTASRASDHGTPPRRVSAPWDGLLVPDPVARAGLVPDQEALVGIAVALRRIPAEVRAAAFERRARAWSLDRRGGRTGPQAPADDGLTRVLVPTERPPAAEAGPRSPTSIRGGGLLDRPPISAPPPSRRRPAPADHPSQLARPVATLVPALADAAAGAVDDGGSPWDALAGDARRAGATRSGYDVGSRVTSVVDVAAPGPLAVVVRTELGGVFHLVPLAQALGLYGDFTTPAEPGIQLGLWDFVTLLGTRLLTRPLPRDPVWALLAELAGRRPGPPPGRGFRPPAVWRVPQAWLAPFSPGGTWRYSVEGDRTVLLHPAGFPVVDGRGIDLQRQLRRYGARPARPSVAPGGGGTAREQWLDHVASYLRARLAIALGVGRRGAADLAFRRPARVLVTDSRLDVISALADLPIVVRLAGLDRDPGYVPAVDRSLWFHFE